MATDLIAVVALAATLTIIAPVVAIVVNAKLDGRRCNHVPMLCAYQRSDLTMAKVNAEATQRVHMPAGVMVARLSA